METEDRDTVREARECTCRTCMYWLRSREDPEDGWCMVDGSAGAFPCLANYGCGEYTGRL